MFRRGKTVAPSLPLRLGGIGLTMFHEEVQHEYANSWEITNLLKNSIVKQLTQKRKNKSKIKSKREIRQKELLDNIRLSLDENKLRLNESNRDKGASNWLTLLPIKNYGFDLNKQQFWDSVRLRYIWVLSNLPSMCACVSRFDVQHAMNCNKGGFVIKRHNNVRDITIFTSHWRNIGKKVNKNIWRSGHEVFGWKVKMHYLT